MWLYLPSTPVCAAPKDTNDLTISRLLPLPVEPPTKEAGKEKKGKGKKVVVGFRTTALFHLSHCTLLP